MYMTLIGWVMSVFFSLSILPFSSFSIFNVYSYTLFFLSSTYLAKAAYPLTFSRSLLLLFLPFYFFLSLNQWLPMLIMYIYTYPYILYEYINSRVVECSFLCKNSIIKKSILYCTREKQGIYEKKSISYICAYHTSSNRIYQLRLYDINRFYFTVHFFAMILSIILHFVHFISSIRRRMLRQVRKLITFLDSQRVYMYLFDNRLFKVEKTLSFLFFSFRMYIWWENLNDVHSLTWIAYKHLKVTKYDRNCSMYCAYIIIITIII